METTVGKRDSMGRVVTGVTLQTLPSAVRRVGLRPGQRFTLIVENDQEDRDEALRRINEISSAVTARAVADGIVTDEDVERFIKG